MVAEVIEGTVEMLDIAPCVVCGKDREPRSRELPDGMALGWWACPDGHDPEPE